MNFTNTQIALIVILGLLLVLLFINNNQLNSLCDFYNDDGNYERMTSCGAVQNRNVANNNSTIKNENLDSGNVSNPSLVLYYTAWCGHSRSFISGGWSDFLTLVKSTPAIKDKLNVKMISCEDEQDKCAAEGVNGYPTIILYVAGKPIQFNGNRTSAALAEFVSKYIYSE